MKLPTLTGHARLYDTMLVSPFIRKDGTKVICVATPFGQSVEWTPEQAQVLLKHLTYCIEACR